jgi:hypothetical protein
MYIPNIYIRITVDDDDDDDDDAFMNWTFLPKMTLPKFCSINETAVSMQGNL